MQSTVCPEQGQAQASTETETSYLETYQKSCGNESEEHFEQFDEWVSTYQLIGCSCKSRFCPECCIPMGWKLRDELKQALASFSSLQMWTLTIDPELFESPAAAYAYCREKRVIGELVKYLAKEGVLESPRYFVAVEWQKSTEMVHYHLLLDAKFIPWELIRDRWNRFRPRSAGPVEGERPGFGSIWFSVPKFESSDHAANYATKYVLKVPDHGFPDWVLDWEGNVPRFHVSKGFWHGIRTTSPAKEQQAETEEVEDEWATCGPACFCAHCREGETLREPERERRRYRTIRQRIAKCKDSSVVLEIRTLLRITGEVEQERHYLGHVPASYQQALDLVGRYDQGRGRVDISLDDACFLLNPWESSEWIPAAGPRGGLQGTLWK